MENYAMNKVRGWSNFRELLDASIEEYGERDMFREKEGEGVRATSAPQFQQLVCDLGAAFLELGLLDGKIAVLGETSVKWIAAYFAAVCGAGVIVPVDKELPDDEIANVINDSGASAVVYAPSYEGVMRHIRDRIPGVSYLIGMGMQKDEGDFLSFDALVRRGAQIGHEAYLARRIDENAMSSLLYTSGTTGKSKGVMLTQKSILCAAEGALALLEVGQVCMSVLPIHHSYEFTHGIVMMIGAGATVCINDSLRYFMQNLQLFQPDTLCLVPLFVEMIHRKIWANAQQNGTEEQLKELIAKSNALLAQGIDKRGTFFKSIRDALGGKLELIICGGAPLAAFYSREFREMGILLLQGYGITECSPLVSVNRNRYNVDGSIGLPIACCDVKIEEKDEDGDGEIWVRGSNVMLGYYQNPEATAEVMRDGWFNTGDIGHLDERGFLYITGRKKNLIVLSNGKNVYPEEIEGYLMRIPYIKEIVVYAPIEEGTEVRLCAEIFVDEAYIASHTPQQVRESLEQDIVEINKTLPGYKQVHEFHVRDREFEKTTKKSIKRFTLQK